MRSQCRMQDMMATDKKLGGTAGSKPRRGSGTEPLPLLCSTTSGAMQWLGAVSAAEAPRRISHELQGAQGEQDGRMVETVGIGSGHTVTATRAWMGCRWIKDEA